MDATSPDGLKPTVATLPGDDLKIVARWLQLIESIFGEAPDVIGDLVLLRAQLTEVAQMASHPYPDALATVTLRYGLTDGMPQSLQEVAVQFGCTRERVRQVEKGVFHRLRFPRYSRPLRAGFYTSVNGRASGVL